MSKYERKIINKLVDKYEKSKSFIGENKVQQTFSIKVVSLFPKYTDHANYEVFRATNEAIDILVRKGIIIANANAANVYSSVALNLDQVESSYRYIGRVPKRDVNISLMQLLTKYKDKNEISKRYCKAQIQRIQANKSVQFFNNDLIELENILVAVDELLKIEIETYARDFSVRVFKDSKLFEKLIFKVVNLVYEYGDFPEKEQVLGNLNIIKNPTYVNLKGAGIITINGQTIDLSKLRGDIALSSAMLPDIDRIDVTGTSVITIENLTSFHTFKDQDMLVVYLGGYHNRVRREFIKEVHRNNPEIFFYHFGDIDAGGFNILEHLRKQTGVDFQPYKMDVETLKDNINYTKSLTDNDRIRLLKLKDSQYCNVVSYMLENNCKLEQEAISAM